MTGKNFYFHSAFTNPAAKNCKKPQKITVKILSLPKPRIPKSLLILSLPVFLLSASAILYVNIGFSTPVNGKQQEEINPHSPEELSETTAFESSDNGNIKIAISDIADLGTAENEARQLTSKNPLAASKINPWQFELYTVNKGDTIWHIARNTGISIDTILSANRIIAAQNIHPGQKIRIPQANGVYYQIRKGDSYSSLARRYNIREEDIRTANNSLKFLRINETVFLPDAKLPLQERMTAFGVYFEKPAEGTISSRYGLRLHPILKRRLFHSGLDIAGREGDKIKSIQDGQVFLIQRNLTGYGNYIGIKHSSGFSSYYAHLKDISIQENVKLKKGDVIGTLGSTGLSTGPHLHLEIRQFGKFVNPLNFIKF